MESTIIHNMTPNQLFAKMQEIYDRGYSDGRAENETEWVTFGELAQKHRLGTRAIGRKVAAAKILTSNIGHEKCIRRQDVFEMLKTPGICKRNEAV